MQKFVGLTEKEAQEKLRQFGKNEIKETNKSSALQILFRQLRKNFVIYLLLATTVVSFLLGKNSTGIVISVVIAIVVITGFIQEYKAEKAINALKDMIMPTSRVIRDGKEREIPSKEIAVGDILVLRTGERVPADCVVVEEKNLRVNESILTGESIDIKKIVGSVETYSDENSVFMGSFVVSGRCNAIVVQTGMNTKFGKIAGMISTAEKWLPLQDKVNRISKYMVFVGLTAATLTGVTLYFRAEFMTPEVLVNILIVVIAFAVSSFPEGFPVVLTTTLAAGVSRMAKQNAIVNRMSIIETLGETSVICSDKTGTLTKGEMTVKKLFVNQTVLDVSGVGYEAKGEVVQNGNKISSELEILVKKLARTAALCNDSNIELTAQEDVYKVSGSATEGALLIFCAKMGIFKEDFANPRIEEMPFDSNRKMMSTLYQEGDKKVAYLKGAPEIILGKCTRIEKEGQIVALTEDDRQHILKNTNDFSSQAFRSLALAYNEPASMKSATSFEEDLIFLGIVALEDPPREEVAPAIALCFKSGIKVKMITGDYSETAKAIARQIGLEGNVLSGEQISLMNDDELEKAVKETVIFCRVQPEHKLRIVRALKANGEIVTMTGDGVNDAPALKEAHIGVAMGVNGTDVSRSVADITLKDDNFATIVVSIKEGRTIFNNIRKFVTYQLSCNLSDIFILFSGILVAPYLGWFVPIITALQILFMNIVTDNIPAITLGFNPTSKDIMSEKPRKNAQILTGEFIRLILLNGLTMGLIAFTVSYLSYNVFSFPKEMARTTVLVSMILVQIANAYNFRSFRYGVIGRGLLINKILVLASMFSVCATVAIVHTPLNALFETTPLGPINWLIAACAAIAIVVLFDIHKFINNRTGFFLKSVH